MISNRTAHLPLAALVCAAGMLFAGALAAQERFQVRISTVPIERATEAATTGHGSAEVELDGDRLTIDGTFEGMQGNATGAWLHVGLARGVRGPALQALTVTPGTSGSVTGSVRLGNPELEALRAGRLYIQIHSEAAPDGNLWGWLAMGAQ